MPQSFLFSFAKCSSDSFLNALINIVRNFYLLLASLHHVLKHYAILLEMVLLHQAYSIPRRIFNGEHFKFLIQPPYEEILEKKKHFSMCFIGINIKKSSHDYDKIV